MERGVLPPMPAHTLEISCVFHQRQHARGNHRCPGSTPGPDYRIAWHVHGVCKIFMKPITRIEDVSFIFSRFRASQLVFQSESVVYFGASRSWVALKERYSCRSNRTATLNAGRQVTGLGGLLQLNCVGFLRNTSHFGRLGRAAQQSTLQRDEAEHIWPLTNSSEHQHLTG